MTLNNNNSGAMHLVGSTVSWNSGTTLTALDFRSVYWSGSNGSGSSNEAVSPSQPLDSGGSNPDWTATFDDVGPGTYTVSLNFGCTITRSVNVAATPVPPTSDLTATANAEASATAAAQTATAQAEADASATAVSLTATAGAPTPAATPTEP